MEGLLKRGKTLEDLKQVTTGEMRYRDFMRQNMIES